MSQDLIPVNVWLAGRSYRIRIRPEEEANVRRAVKQADAKIAELRQHYAGRDDQDFVAMCLLMYAADNGSLPAQHVLEEELGRMVGRIDTVLGKEDES